MKVETMTLDEAMKGIYYPNEQNLRDSLRENRSASWGHWSITFYHATANGYDAESFDFELPFSVGAQGPIDGFLGSKLRMFYQNSCKNWRERGEIPEGALCFIDKRWMYVREK